MAVVARLHGPKDLRISTEPPPGPAPDGYSRIAVTSVGICGSDLHWFLEGGIGETTITDPVVPGHEFAGVVREGPLAGRRVAVDPAIPCGTCERCRAGHGNLCEHFARVRIAPGGFAERLHATHALPLPDSVRAGDGIWVEPLACVLRGAEQVPRGRVLLAGCGAIGQLTEFRLGVAQGNRSLWHGITS